MDEDKKKKEELDKMYNDISEKYFELAKVYGNIRADQLVMQEEIKELKEQVDDYKVIIKSLTKHSTTCMVISMLAIIVLVAIMICSIVLV